jgi:hypothetical protein
MMRNRITLTLMCALFTVGRCAHCQPAADAQSTAAPVKGEADSPEIPPYFVEEFSIVQTAPAGDHIEFELRGSIRLTSSSRQPERIPLLLGNCALLDSKFTGEGSHVVDVAEGGGYELWVNGAADSQHDFVLTFARKLVLLGRGRRLQLQLPARTIPIQLWLDEVNPKVFFGDSRTIKEFQGPGEKVGTWRLDLRALGGDFRLQWQPSNEPGPPDRRGLTAVGEIDYQFLNDRQLDASAKIRVSNPRGGLSSFLVRLPPGFVLTENDGAEFSTTVVEAGNATHGPSVRVDVLEPQATSAQVTLQAKLTKPAFHPNQEDGFPATELAGFAVDGATFQANRLNVRFPSKWSLHSLTDLNARRVDGESTVDSDREGQAYFDVFHQAAQPPSLTVALRERQTRIIVQPTYRLFVEGTRVVMDARMRFDVRGTVPRKLSIWTGDWKLISLDTTVAPGAEISTSTGGVQDIPIEIAELAATPFDVNIRGEMPLSSLPTRPRISLPDPRPILPVQGQAVVASPPRLILLVASGLDVVPRLEDPAYSFEEPPNEWALTGDATLEAGRASYIQFETNVTPTVTLSVAARAQAFSGEVDTEVHVSQSKTLVKQTFQVDVLNQPLNRLPLSFPANAMDLEITIGEERLVVPDWPPTEKTAGRLDREVLLPGSPRLGRITLNASFHLPGVPRSKETTATSIGLINWQANGWETVENHITVRDGLTRELNLSAATWAQVFGNSRETLEAKSDKLQDDLAIAIAPSISQGRRTDIEKTWIRTILVEAGRIDHFCVRLHATDSIIVRLPPGVRDLSQTITIALNGRSVTDFKLLSDRAVEIPIPAGESGRSMLMEVWYEFDASFDSNDHFLFATVSDARGVGRTYWELLTDRRRHLLVPPSICFSENEWVASGIGWRRQPTLTTTELREWIEMSGRDTDLAGANRYLYSAFGTVDAVRVTTCSRTLLVFAASFASLLLGLAVLYWAPARHPLALAVGGVLLLACVVRWPATGVLALQAAVAGASLVGLSLALRWWYRPSAPRIFGATESRAVPESDGLTTTRVVGGVRSPSASDSGSQTFAGSGS